MLRNEVADKEDRNRINHERLMFVWVTELLNQVFVPERCRPKTKNCLITASVKDQNHFFFSQGMEQEKDTQKQSFLQICLLLAQFSPLGEFIE